jgi:predicted nucleotidyltransferase
MGEADPTAPLSPQECRDPTLEDVVKLCRALNEAGAHYVVVGGFAIRAAGFSRTTSDIDLLVETGPENEARVIQGLMSLPDQAVREIKPGEVEEYGVVRVADEILVDLMRSGCDVRYADARPDASVVEVDGVPIPFASPLTLWKMKQTHREKDIPDRLFLRQLLAAQGIQVEEAPRPAQPTGLRAWLQRTFGS